MRISPERLTAEAEETGFQPEVWRRPSTSLDCSMPSTAIRSCGAN